MAKDRGYAYVIYDELDRTYHVVTDLDKTRSDIEKVIDKVVHKCIDVRV